MAYSVEFKDAHRIVEITLSAQITAQDLVDVTRNAIHTGLLHQTHLYLIQFVEPNISASLASVYDLPSQYHAQNVDRRSRIAVINPEPEAAQEIVRFYETVCLNRGWSAHTFPNREKALDWLLDENPLPHPR